MIDQMNVSLENNGKRQGSMRSEDHEALKLVELERSRGGGAHRVTTVVTVLAKPRKRSVRLPERFGSACFLFWRAQPISASHLMGGKPAITSDPMRHSKSSGSRLLLHLFIFSFTIAST
jgi:hypothetical protein